MKPSVAKAIVKRLKRIEAEAERAREYDTALSMRLTGHARDIRNLMFGAAVLERCRGEPTTIEDHT